MNVIILGAPGAGKGTAAGKICDRLQIPHISTGDIFRANIRNQTELGKVAKSYIDKGELVPDSVVIDIVNDRLSQEDCSKGYLLDGFPRTIAQADALDKITSIDCVLNLDVKDEVIIKRLEGRRACPCGHTSHVNWLNGATTCPKCGQPLYQRDDDKAETVQNRLDVYYENTAPLIDYYKNKGLLKTVDGNGEVEEILTKLFVQLGVE